MRKNRLPKSASKQRIDAFNQVAKPQNSLKNSVFLVHVGESGGRNMKKRRNGAYIKSHTNPSL
jgi:hypothetical protein